MSSKGAVTLRQEADNSMAKVQRFFRRKGKCWRKLGKKHFINLLFINISKYKNAAISDCISHFYLCQLLYYCLNFSRSEKITSSLFTLLPKIFVPLTLSKVLTFDNKSEKRLFPFVLCSLNRTFALKIKLLKQNGIQF